MFMQGHSHEQIVKEHKKEQVFKQVQIGSLVMTFFILHIKIL
jgi:hypothetical protein